MVTFPRVREERTIAFLLPPLLGLRSAVIFFHISSSFYTACCDYRKIPPRQTMYVYLGIPHCCGKRHCRHLRRPPRHSPFIFDSDLHSTPTPTPTPTTPTAITAHNPNA
ncbi:hypothetical protein K458DRAFT_20797 [Lentithecium fluviatile CBS 122367]|uniref:Uncharacterized protein n=1 Tax=Lentithecium fluviatile CBS 122367 TaxID=1168545 RepID=A0A6G1J4K7_9PLEO|nr:hypothetical protein K458DRAFT_20797 [Lentithecium fluviatile CBS 122367]